MALKLWPNLLDHYKFDSLTTNASALPEGISGVRRYLSGWSGIPNPIMKSFEDSLVNSSGFQQVISANYRIEPLEDLHEDLGRLAVVQHDPDYDGGLSTSGSNAFTVLIDGNFVRSHLITTSPALTQLTDNIVTSVSNNLDTDINDEIDKIYQIRRINHEIQELNTPLIRELKLDGDL